MLFSNRKEDETPQQDHMLGVQSALILLFDGLEPHDIMDVLDGVLPKELSLWHASDTNSVLRNAHHMSLCMKHILDKTEDGTGIGTLAVKDIAYQCKLALNDIERINVIATSVSKSRRAT